MKSYKGHIKKGDVFNVLFRFDDESELADELAKETQEDECVDDMAKEPEEKAKGRPAVVLFQAGTNSFVVCAITTSPNTEYRISLKGRDIDAGKMPSYKPSFIRPNIINTLNRSLFENKIGTLTSEKLGEVTNKVKEFLDRDAAPASQALARPKKKTRYL